MGTDSGTRDTDMSTDKGHGHGAWTGTRDTDMTPIRDMDGDTDMGHGHGHTGHGTPTCL